MKYLFNTVARSGELQHCAHGKPKYSFFFFLWDLSFLSKISQCRSPFFLRDAPFRPLKANANGDLGMKRKLRKKKNISVTTYMCLQKISLYLDIRDECSLGFGHA